MHIQSTKYHVRGFAFVLHWVTRSSTNCIFMQDKCVRVFDRRNCQRLSKSLLLELEFEAGSCITTPYSIPYLFQCVADGCMCGRRLLLRRHQRRRGGPNSSTGTNISAQSYLDQWINTRAQTSLSAIPVVPIYSADHIQSIVHSPMVPSLGKSKTHAPFPRTSNT